MSNQKEDLPVEEVAKASWFKLHLKRSLEDDYGNKDGPFEI